MNIMKTTDRTDRFQLKLYSKMNPLKQGYEAVAEIVENIIENAGDFAPDRISVGRAPRKYSPTELKRVLSTQVSDVKPSFALTRSSQPDVLYTLSFLAETAPLGFTFSMMTPISCFTENDQAEVRSQAVVSTVKSLTRLCSPTYAYGHCRADVSLSSDPRKETSFVPNKIYEIYWLNLLGPEMAQHIGRARVLSTPAFQIEELPGGSVLLLTRPTPADFASTAARLAQARAFAHLREGVDMNVHLARLMERTSKLTPLTHDWDPDIADLLELTLADVSFGERQSKTAELNRYRPPEVSEWRPADQLLKSDVENLEETLDEYGIFAEKLAALLHKEVPSVMEESPASLPLIDYHFWHFKYAEEFTREDIETDLVPAVGAYLGDVIIRNLGGHWVPRKKIDESQLVLADRVWLPFLRARRHLQSTQAALDYSLTKFYRVVERHSKQNPTAGVMETRPVPA
jgi:hypothetical protein